MLVFGPEHDLYVRYSKFASNNLQRVDNFANFDVWLICVALDLGKIWLLEN